MRVDTFAVVSVVNCLASHLLVYHASLTLLTTPQLAHKYHIHFTVYSLRRPDYKYYLLLYDPNKFIFLDPFILIIVALSCDTVNHSILFIYYYFFCFFFTFLVAIVFVTIFNRFFFYFFFYFTVCHRLEYTRKPFFYLVHVI